MDVNRSSKDERRPDIDVLRVAGTLAVFLFHSIQPFNPNETWHVVNSARSPLAAYLISFLNLWIMPLFMTLAGFSAWFALQKRTTRQFLIERVIRIFVPLVLGIFVFVSPQVYIERLRDGSFHGSFIEFFPHFFDGVYPSGNFSWHHLWFLAYLFVYSIVALPLFQALKSERAKSYLTSISSLTSHRGVLLSVGCILGALQAGLQFTYPQTNALINDWTWHSQLFTVFVIGYVLASNVGISQAIKLRWRFHLSISVGLTVLFFVFKNVRIVPSSSWYWFVVVAKAMVFRICTWSWILGFMGLFQEKASRIGWKIAYASQAAFPFYIIHQTVIVLVASRVISLGASVFLKWILLASVSLFSTLFIYEMARRLWMGRLILGLKSTPLPKGSAIQAMPEVIREI